MRSFKNFDEAAPKIKHSNDDVSIKGIQRRSNDFAMRVKVAKAKAKAPKMRDEDPLVTTRRKDKEHATAMGRHVKSGRKFSDKTEGTAPKIKHSNDDVSVAGIQRRSNDMAGWSIKQKAAAARAKTNAAGAAKGRMDRAHARSNAMIGAAMKRGLGLKTAKVVSVNKEEVQDDNMERYVTELSRKSLGSYTDKAIASRDKNLAAKEKHGAAYDKHDDKYQKSKGKDKKAYARREYHYPKFDKARDNVDNRTAGIKLAKDKFTREETQIEGIDKMSSPRLKYHITKKFPHGRFTDKEVKDEHKRRGKAEPNYHKVKPQLEVQDANMDKYVAELSRKSLGSYIGSASVDKSHQSHEIGRINQTAATVGTTASDRKERERLNKKHGNRSAGINRAADKLAKEDVQIDELSRKTIGSYATKAQHSVHGPDADVTRKKSFLRKFKTGGGNPTIDKMRDDAKKGLKKLDNKRTNRQIGMMRAIRRLSKEDVQIDELSKKTLGSYVKKTSRDVASRDRRAGYKIGRYGSATGLNKANVKNSKRQIGLDRAVNRLTKEHSMNHVTEISQDVIDRYREKAHKDTKQRDSGRSLAHAKSTGRAKMNPPESVRYSKGANVYPSKKVKAVEIEVGIQKTLKSRYRK